ncbi:hypothetical protein [Roseococcus pinisoli]|uniref:Secreted protein n=1 Tax=Roseococcus pinisoli TaxID=2835040 RepID=A0ABS5Q9E3_9PROT|nr:hypothetical protein [Roseococcus pinisoli]MBS7809816.1 hypothetical protein [Roseococcus pinisoli]
MFRRPMFAVCLAVMAASPAFAQKSAPSTGGSPGGNPGFRLENSTSNIINNVYASPTSNNSWGNDRLGSNEVIQAGASRDFQLPPGECMYDVRVVYQGGVAEERRRVNACTERTVVLPMAAQRLVR